MVAAPGRGRVEVGVRGGGGGVMVAEGEIWGGGRGGFEGCGAGPYAAIQKMGIARSERSLRSAIKSDEF